MFKEINISNKTTLTLLLTNNNFNLEVPKSGTESMVASMVSMSMQFCLENKTHRKLNLNLMLFFSIQLRKGQNIIISFIPSLHDRQLDLIKNMGTKNTSGAD